ncbi:MFS transporter [Inquilinus limosus]|uniref:MFS transporter n=1 Tax=Inquilinus limosus TaxID=171674 RepID=A0A211ZTS0_9PROT|nr:MFS transporter [Inquilinus limosus]OWJ68665.1 MFS transporter [Inquilinus limosus]
MTGRSTIWILAVACGVVVANNYYNQPLLVDFAETFQATQREAGSAAIVTQAGYALGMLLFVPLGDMIDRRLLIGALLLASAGALAATALAPSLPWLIIACFAVGFTSVVPQVTVPFAAHLAPPQERGRAVGTVLGALLCGILLSRTVAGFVGAHWGWRAMFWIAAGVMIVLLLVLSILLPKDQPSFDGRYGTLMASLGRLVREQPVLRETSMIGALQFGAFTACWTTLAFHLDAMPAHYGSDVAGLFGVIGLVAMVVVPAVGRLADKGSPQRTVLLSSIAVLVTYGLLAVIGGSIWGLIAGFILLDVAVQSGHVSNMTRNVGLKADAMSRLNTVYMVSRFIGGAVGSTLGNLAWSLWQWPGVCAVGLLLSALAIAVQLRPRASSVKPTLP